MNRNDFYKELMSRYALDEEKIRTNALKQAKKPAWQRIAADYWKPAVGTAAAVAVTVAAVAYVNSAASAPDITPPPRAALSAAQRLSEAEQNYYNLQAADPFSDIYITFLEPISYNDVIMAFSTIADPGEIKLESLYTETGTFFGSDSVRAYAAEHAGEKILTAAKVSALSGYYRDIQDLSKVYLAEFGSADINDDTFAPLPVDDSDPLSEDIVNIPATAVPVTTTEFSFNPTEPTTAATEAPASATDTSEEETTLVPPEDTLSDTGIIDPDDIEPEETTSAGDDIELEETTPDTGAAVPEETTVPEEVPPANEITTVGQENAGVSLLTELYELKIENSLETYLCGNNAVVLTKNMVYLYTFGMSASQSSSFEMTSPKVSYKDGGTLIITGCSADDVRNVVNVISFDTDEMHVYDVSGNIGEASIGAIHYYPKGNKYFIKSVNGNKSFVYEAVISSASGISFRPLAESDGPVSIAGCKGDLLFLAKADESSGNTNLYTFNCVSGEVKEVAEFDSVMKLRRGTDMESFALISPENSYIYDVNTGMLINGVTADDTTELKTVDGKTYFSAGSTVYEINPNTQVGAVNRYIEFNKKLESELEVNEATPEKIVIVRKNNAKWINN